jgi:hypothetical protein
MKNQQTLAIVFLLISAAVLSLMLYIAVQTQDAAQAGSSESRSGDFIMVPGSRATAADNIYVIDVQRQRMALYISEPGRGDLQPRDVIDLGRYFGAGN